MASKRKRLEEFVPTDMDLFEGAPRSYVVTDSEFVAHKPVNALAGASHIEFFSVGKGASFYRRFKNIYLRATFKLTNPDGTALPTGADDAKVTLVNNALHSVIGSVNLWLNGTDVCPHSDHYAHSAYIQTLLSFSPEDSTHRLPAELFYRDTGAATHKFDASNEGVVARYNRLKGDTEVEVYGKLLLDICTCDLVFPDNIDVRVRLNLNESPFYLLASKAATAVLQISKVSLYMEQLQVQPSLLLAHAQAFTKSNAIFHYKRIIVKQFTVGGKQQSFNIENAWVGKAPLVMLMALVDNEACVGNILQSPFCFKHFSVNTITFELNNKQYRIDDMDFAKDKYTFAFASLYAALGVHRAPESSLVTFDAYKHGSFITGVDFSLDKQGLNSGPGQSQTGNVRVEVAFKTAPDKAISVILMGLFDGSLEIDHERHVTYIDN